MHKYVLISLIKVEHNNKNTENRHILNIYYKILYVYT